MIGMRSRWGVCVAFAAMIASGLTILAPEEAAPYTATAAGCTANTAYGSIPSRRSRRGTCGDRRAFP
jgi:hypothetical protein